MKFIAVDQDIPGRDWDIFKANIKDEIAKVWEFYQAGIVREQYFMPEMPGAVYILECENLDEAKKIIGELPLVKIGWAKFDIHTLAPFTHFDMLFTQEQK